MFVGTILCCTGALRADIVVLQNGDRLTGEVQKLEQGKLSFKTTYAGTVSIDWQQVRQVTSGGVFEVEVESGRRYRGTMEEADEGVEIVREDVSQTVDPQVIVGLTPVSDGEPPGFWQILEGALDIGFSFTRGNSRLDQSSLGIHGKYRRETYNLQGSATSLFNQVDDSEPTSRQTANLRYDRFINPKAFYFSLVALERNDRQRLNLRSRLGGGFGWKLIKNRHTEFSLLGGVTFINEQFRDADSGADLPRESSGEALGGFEFETTRFDRVQITTDLSIHPNLRQSGRYRVEYDSTLRVPLFRNLTWSVSLFDRFDSDPPLEVQRNDYGVVSAFGLTF